MCRPQRRAAVCRRRGIGRGSPGWRFCGRRGGAQRRVEAVDWPGWRGGGVGGGLRFPPGPGPDVRALSAHDNLAGLPTDGIELERENLAGAQSEPRQEQQDRNVAAPARRRTVCCRDYLFYLFAREHGAGGGLPPADRGYFPRRACQPRPSRHPPSSAAARDINHVPTAPHPSSALHHRLILEDEPMSFDVELVAGVVGAFDASVLRGDAAMRRSRSCSGSRRPH